MDIEFHYYMTYLIATRAGFNPHDAWLIAHSAQGVDDNHIPVKVVDDSGAEYSNALSQTMDIVRPHEDLYIYPIFHFIPGEQDAPSAARLDHRTDPFVTTPNSPLANKMIDAALASGDPYRIGVSAHGYVDTWAHQNFLGKRDTFNTFSSGIFAEVREFLAVGHAAAKHQPDMPGLEWEDNRLVNSKVVNRDRFMDAATHLFQKLALHVQPGRTEADLAVESKALVADLDADIGPRDDINAYVKDRIARYIERSREAAYGASTIPDYFDGEWFSEAIREDHDTVREQARGVGASSIYTDIRAFAGDFFADRRRQTVHWKNSTPETYRLSNWFSFQEAIKAHLSQCKGFLAEQGLLPD
jgi:hypothetical protein